MSLSNLLDDIMRDDRLRKRHMSQSEIRARGWCGHCTKWQSGQPCCKVRSEDKPRPNDYQDPKMQDMQVEANGAKHSKIPYRMDLIWPNALLALARIFGEGAKTHGETNYRNLDKNIVYNHLMTHLVQWKSGDQSEEHLAHALCRLVMLMELDNAVPY